MSVPTKDFFEFGSFTVDAVERVLLRNNQPVAMTQKVFDLLLVLVRNSGHVVDKEKLMREIWPDSFVEEGNLTQNISLLRKVLNGDGHQYIQTVPRRGYRFVGHVREVGVESSLLIEEHSLARLVVEETHLDHATRESSAVVDLAVAAQPQPAQRRPWRKPALIAGALLGAFAALGIGWSIFGFRNVSSSNPPPFDVNNVTLRRITSTGNIVYGLISSDGQFVAYCTLDEDNRYALWLQHAGSKDALRLIAPAEGSVGPVAISHDNNWIYYGQVKPNDRRGGVTIYRMPLLGGAPRKVLESVHVFAALSPDDQRILLHRFKDGGGIDVISVNAFDGGDERLLATSDRASDYLGTRWSPDGSKLLFFRMEQRADGTFWSLNEMPAQGGPSKAILPPAQRRIWFVDWADQGRGIVMNATDPVTKMPQLYYVSYPLGETRRITNDLVGYTTISVGGETIMAGKVERQSKVWVTNWPAPEPGRQVIERDLADGLAWTPDAHIIFDTNDNGRIHLWSADADGGQRQQMSPDNTEERQPDVSPDGKLIAFISRRSGYGALWMMDADGRNARQMTSGSVRPWRPRFAPDGQSIYFLMEQAEIPVLAKVSVAGGEPIVITRDVNSESFYDISPDGQSVAYTFFDKARQTTRVAVRALTEGATPLFFEFEPSYFLRWTPDGKSLAYAQLPADKKKGEAFWLQPISGGPAQQVLNVAPDLIYWVAWSRDGKQLAISHGRFVTDIVLISRNKSPA